MLGAADAAGRLRPSGHGERISIRAGSDLLNGEPVSNAGTDHGFRLKKDDIMRDFRDAKTMAKTLRAELSRLGLDEVTHSQSLEIVARQFGFDDWNILAAKLSAAGHHRGGGIDIESATPVLRIFSVEKAKEFYLEFLGFNLGWEHRYQDGMPLYMQVERGSAVLHLSEHHGDGSPGAVVFVPMTGLEAFHGELAAKDYPYMNPGIEEAPWGAKLMTVIDPFGNTLRFNEFQ
jgi:catechol 2,3-dioxygenase-like lactoylglutathione lyase family enzyme